TSYLSKTAIYTLTPRHEVKPSEDPVAPFMFGDHRGYCVHFAHAITYMARALGIPARVATGYLTDLSQAKDGHILLRMSDRHAWGEIYITEIGWVPFDVQPEQVESHAETQVDAKLLEELMGILQPGEEILPKDSVKDEAGMLDPDQIWTPDPQLFINLLYLSAALFLLLKLTLRQGWRLARSPSTRLRWGYISVASSLCDIGITRERGETRLDFANRVTQVDLRPLTQLVVTKGYSSNYQLQMEAVTRTIKATQSPLKNLPRWKRPIVAVNPASIVKMFGGASW
ncbi:MAG: transglutaminase-like domain-containing protein, partial [bacterium]